MMFLNAIAWLGIIFFNTFFLIGVFTVMKKNVSNETKANAIGIMIGRPLLVNVICILWLIYGGQ